MFQQLLTQRNKVTQTATKLYVKGSYAVQRTVKKEESDKSLHWDQIANMVFVGLAIWLITQNSPNAKNMVTVAINTTQNTVTKMLSNWNG